MITLIMLTSTGLDIYDNMNDKLKETINYLIVGGLTTVVSIVSYLLFRLVISNITVCTILSWICAVAFAYFANRIFVFKSKSKKYVKEVSSFVGSRIFSLLVEIAFMFVTVTLLHIDDRIAKLLVQVIITVLNYITSKLFVFKKKKD